jgi:AcrR family transcriptional regulator
VSGSTLRDRRRASTRREIVRAAQILVERRGLAEVTVEEIAEAAGVSPRTFFNYFPSKRSAVVPGPEPLPSDAIERFVADRDTPLLDGLRELLIHGIGASEEERSTFQNTHRIVTAHPELTGVLFEHMAEFEAVLVNAVARRLDTSPDTDDRPLVAAAVAGTVLRLAVTRPDAEDSTLGADIDRAFTTLRAVFTS